MESMGDRCCPVLDEAMGFFLLKLLALTLFDCRGGSMENYDFYFIIPLAGKNLSFARFSSQ
jgi:hypothetical protein